MLNEWCVMFQSFSEFNGIVIEGSAWEGGS